MHNVIYIILLYTVNILIKSFLNYTRQVSQFIQLLLINYDDISVVINPLINIKV